MVIKNQKKPTKLKIGGIVDHSTVDFIGRTCAVVYLCGCCFRCPWCQNRELVLEEGPCTEYAVGDIISKLKENFLVDAICITGGEPTMQEEVIELAKGIKKEEKTLKTDTNGYFPQTLKKLVPQLDLVTVDLKAPLKKEKYPQVVGLTENNSEILPRIEKSLQILEKNEVPVEIRTTIVPGLVDSKEEIYKIAQVVKERDFNYYTLQSFRAENTLDPEWEKANSPTRERMIELGKEAKQILPKVDIRIVTFQKGFEEIE